MNTARFRFLNDWGLHARPCAYLATIGSNCFAEWDIVAISLKDGREVDAKSILGLLSLAVARGEEIEFLSLMPTEMRNAYVDTISHLFFDAHDQNKHEAYEALERLLETHGLWGGQTPPRCESLGVDMHLAAGQSGRQVMFAPKLPTSSSGITHQEFTVHVDKIAHHSECSVDPGTDWEVFISHHHTDLKHAQVLYELLQAANVRPFLSEACLPKLGISDFQESIEGALEKCQHMIVVSSFVDGISSGWVRAEWSMFLNEVRSGRKQGNLLTLLIGQMNVNELPIALRAFQSIVWQDRNRVIPFIKP